MELLALLCTLGVCCSLALGDDVKAFAPEDLDGSGDDEDDYSGSGTGGVLEVERHHVNIILTSSPLLPTVTQMSTAGQPNLAVEEESGIEPSTKIMETTNPPNIIEDIFAIKKPLGEEVSSIKPSTQQPFIVEYDDDGEKHHPPHHTTTPVSSLSEDDFVVDPVVEIPSAEDATIKPTPKEASTVESVEDLEKKHHNRHHHHHPHHHTTTTAEFGIDEDTTASPEVENPFVLEESTTSTPDEGSEVDKIAQVTPTTEHSVHHDHHQEASSGPSSAPYVDEETTTRQPDIDQFPIFVDSDIKTVTDETHTQKGHHHHLLNHTTASPLNGSDLIIEDTESDVLKPDADHEKNTRTPTEERPDHHHHPHHTAKPSTTQSTAENSFIPQTRGFVHAQDSKGRRVYVPLAETTSAVPVNEDKHIPEFVEPIDSSEGPSGDSDNDFVIEGAVQVVEQDRKGKVADDGSLDASHGIMDRKEILAGIIAGGVAGLAFAAALVAFVFYRMKKKDEGSYSLEEPKQSNGGYQKPREQREFYA